MKKNYFIAILALVATFVNAQIEPTTYVGAFAPSPAAQWTDSWTNWDPQNTAYTDAATVVTVTTNITTSTTWTTGKTYKISGLIYVTNGATLTIQPGVVVKGIYTSTGTALIITKGAKLNAVGTASQPIVFTSAKAAGTRAAGDWGGVILLGKASFNINAGINNIEGITATANTEYGGGTTPDDNDNSGSMKYCRIEFPGFVFSPNNEINGLTFGAVGRGTAIDYVQVSYSGDDSFEWFGGTVNCKHLVAYRGIDDDFDTDNGYSGVNQFGLGIRDPQLSDNPAISTSEGFESDNNASGSLVSPYTSCIFSNYTLIGPKYRQTLPSGGTLAGGYKRVARLRRAGKQKIFNSLFLDFKEGLHIDGVACETNALNDELKWKNNIIAGAATTPFLQVNSPGTITAGNNAAFNMTTWYNSNGNQSITSNAGILVLPYDTANAQNYSGLDYRPGTGSPALNAASFIDASLTPYIVTATGTTPIVNNIAYCYKATATPLTATLTTTGVSLKWYTVATGGTASTTAPTPVTTTVGTKTYYVSQVDALNVESSRVPLVVTVNALPTEVITAITGVAPVVTDSAVAIGKYVGTTSQFTYSVPAFVDSSLTYVWSVPNGTTIVSGQGTNTLVVNYANVPSGAGTYGTITIQAENASGCRTAAISLTLTKALPVAPTSLKLFDKNGATPLTAITKMSKYMGTSTVLTLTVGTVATATSYVWELPAGVSLATGGTAGASYVRWFTAQPFDAPLTTQPAPSVGTKYWRVTYNPVTYNVNGVTTVVTTSTCSIFLQGGGLYGATQTLAYPPYGTVITSDQPSILVSFAGVTNPATTTLFLGAKSKNGVGTSVANNNTAGNATFIAANTPGINYTTYTENYVAPVAPSTPASVSFTSSGTTPSTAKLLKLTAVLPSTSGVLSGPIAGLCGGSTYTYTMATAATEASSYNITAPVGSIVTSASNTTNTTNTLNTTDLSFSVQLPANFATLTTPQIVVFSHNVIGDSLLSKTLTLSPAMAAVTTVTGTATTFQRCTSQTFSVNALAGATYTWTPANGAVITAGQGTATVTVDFSAVLSTLTSTKLTVVGTNSCGVSSAAKSITLASAICGAKMAENNLVANTAISVYPNPATSDFNVDVTAVRGGVVTMSIFTIEGAVVSTKDLNVTEGNTTVNENISGLANGIYFVQFVNQATNETIVKKLIKR